MLVLSRKAGQRIVISDEITITVLSVQGSRVRIGLDAQTSIAIRRSELPAWPPVRIKSERGEFASEVDCIVLS